MNKRIFRWIEPKEDLLQQQQPSVLPQAKEDLLHTKNCVYSLLEGKDKLIYKYHGVLNAAYNIISSGY